MKKLLMLLAILGFISFTSSWAMDEECKTKYNDDDETWYQNDDFKVGCGDEEYTEEKVGYIDEIPGDE